MKILLTLISLLIISLGNSLSQDLNTEKIYNSYYNYKESGFVSKRFKHSDIKKKINGLKKIDLFNVLEVGKSIEGKGINLISFGKGKTKVVLWSQMHGDEPTATMALFDLFNFFTAKDYEFNEVRNNILKKLSISIIPMLNPDGAEEFKRRNKLNIDLNRDALRLQSPESKILKSLQDSIKPEFAFNLHDQSTRYTAGNSYRAATISFLAPAFNYEKDINNVRSKTMKLIVNLFNELNKYIPGHIAKYSDDYEPRAFGDNFVKWGTSSVLIESGGWKNDNEKQFIRKLNFIAILTGLHSIANKLYKNSDIEDYKKIPFNDKLLFDLLLRNLKMKYKNNEYLVDVGINREEKLTDDQAQEYYVSNIEDLGDLSIYYGYDDFNLEGYEIRKTKIYNTSILELNELDYKKLIIKGFGFVKIASSNINREYSSIPLNIIYNNSKVNLELKFESFANFTIWKNNKLTYNVINGFIYNVKSDFELKNNGLIFK